MEVSMQMWPFPEPPSPGPGPSRRPQRGQRARGYGSGNLGYGRPPGPPPPPMHRHHRSPILLPPHSPPSNHHDSDEESSESEILDAAENHRYHRKRDLQAFPGMAKEIATEGRGRKALEHSTREEIMPCSVCGKTESTKRCARCKSAAYCGEEHQKADWKTHKKSCASKGKSR